MNLGTSFINLNRINVFTAHTYTIEARTMKIVVFAHEGHLRNTKEQDDTVEVEVDSVNIHGA